MGKSSILVIGSSGYVGKNFLQMCKLNNINCVGIALQDFHNLKFTNYDTIIDFSIPNRAKLPWHKDISLDFTLNHQKLLNFVLKRELRYFRVSSIFDVRNFNRSDDYTILSKRVSCNVLEESPQYGAILYSHALYGGKYSTSVIDNGLFNKEIIVSIRDYVHVYQLCRTIIELVVNVDRAFRKYEICTEKPYLSVDIKEYVSKGCAGHLETVNITSKKFRDLDKKNLVCTAKDSEIINITKVITEDLLSEYLQRFYCNNLYSRLSKVSPLETE